MQFNAYIAHICDKANRDVTLDIEMTNAMHCDVTMKTKDADLKCLFTGIFTYVITNVMKI